MVAQLEESVTRADTEIEHPTSLIVGGLEIDCCRYGARTNGRWVPLSPTEFKLLVYLAKNANRIIPAEEIVAEIWRDGDGGSLRRYIYKLRHRLDLVGRPPAIENRSHYGYGLFA